MVSLLSSQAAARRILLGVAAGIGLLALALPATAEPEPGEGKAKTIEQSQDDLISQAHSDPEHLARLKAQDLNDTITRTAYASTVNGYASAEVGPNTLTLYWKGGLPPSIKAIVSASDVEVEVRQSAYSREEMLATLEKLVLNKPPAIEAAGFVQAAPSADWNSIEVVTIDPLPQTAQSSLAEFDSVPIHFKSGGTRGTVLAGRDQEYAPFFGGAKVWRVQGSGKRTCTTGFSAETADSADGILMARHCGTAKWYTFNTNQYVGERDLARINDTRDAMFNRGGNSYDPAVYIGGFNTAASRLVFGSAPVGKGYRVIVSGGVSGGYWHQVTQVDTYYDSAEVETPGHLSMGPGFHSTDVNGVLSVGSGDSGGPVVNEASIFPNTHVIARGQLSAGAGIGAHPQFGCAGNKEIGDDYRYCSTKGFSINIVDILSSLQVRLLTHDPRAPSP